MTTFDGQKPCDLAFSQGYKTVGTMFFVILMQHLLQIETVSNSNVLS